MKGIRSQKNWYVEFDDPMLLIEYEQKSLFRTSAKFIAKKLKALLDSNPSETKVHEFFEQHPRCLPDGGMYHHGIRGDVVVTKLPLSNDFVTDLDRIGDVSGHRDKQGFPLSWVFAVRRVWYYGNNVRDTTHVESHHN